MVMHRAAPREQIADGVEAVGVHQELAVTFVSVNRLVKNISCMQGW